MVHGVGPSSNVPYTSPDPEHQQLLKWADQVDQWMNTHNVPDTRFFTEVRQVLDNYLNGDPVKYPRNTPIADILKQCFGDKGGLDVYAASNLGDPAPIQNFMQTIFNITPLPDVTPMDKWMMQFQSKLYSLSGLPTKNPDGTPNEYNVRLLALLHDYFMTVGSGGSDNKFQAWIRQQQGTDLFKNASSDAQAFFQQFIDKNYIPR